MPLDQQLLTYLEKIGTPVRSFNQGSAWEKSARRLFDRSTPQKAMIVRHPAIAAARALTGYAVY